MAKRDLTVTVEIELTPTGKALLRLAQVVGQADQAMIPDEVRAAALDVVALAEEHRS